MIYKVPRVDVDDPVVVIDIGNSTINLATWRKSQLKNPLSTSTTDRAGFEEAYAANLHALAPQSPAATVIGSVVPGTLEWVRQFVDPSNDKEALIVGEKITFPIEVSEEVAATIGTDRVCAAAGAYSKLERSCVIVDFGSAITVDLVNDDGILVGGAILPGVGFQLRALHEYAAQLPAVQPEVPESPFGRNTTEAIQVGVCRGISGAVRALTESYAAHLNHWPHVVATGGDIGLIAPLCDCLDTMVENLSLRGLGIAYDKHIQAMGE